MVIFAIITEVHTIYLGLTSNLLYYTKKNGLFFYFTLYKSTEVLFHIYISKFTIINSIFMMMHSDCDSCLNL